MGLSRCRAFGAVALITAGLSGAFLALPPASSVTNCFGRSPTHVMTPGEGSYNGSSGTDVVIGTEGNDTVFGLDGNDYLCGGGGNDTLWGGGGINSFLPGGGNDAVFGNSSFLLDTVWYTDAPGPITATMATATVTGEGTDDLSFIRYVHGSPFGDDLTAANVVGIMYGEGGNDTIRLGTAPGSGAQGLDGDDILIGGPSADQLQGGPGRDELDGGGDHDILVGEQGDDVLRGGEGGDSLHGDEGADDLDGGPGADALDGAGEVSCGGSPECVPVDSSGADLVRYDGAPGPVQVDLDAGTAAGHGSDVVLNVERVVGSDFGDALTGSPAAETLSGRGGADGMLGGAGKDNLLGGLDNDTLGGGADNDMLAGGTGDDSLLGGVGRDVVRFGDVAAGVVADLAAQTATGQGADSLVGVEDLTGSSRADTLRGNSSANTLSGGNGRDRLVGRLGRDRCLGGSGVDTASTCEVRSSVP